MMFKIKYFLAIFLSIFFKTKNNINFILMYHEITKSHEDNIFSVSIQNFKSQILFLIKKYHNSNIENFFRKNNSFVITFDDGYEDIYHLVFPFIKKYNIHVTIFLTLSNLNKENYLKDYQINEMLNSGIVQIGCHGNTHKSLRSLKTHELYNEINFPKKYFEEKFKIKILYLSFPNGIYDTETINYCKKIKIKKTFNSHLQTIELSKFKIKYTLPRICIYNIDNLFSLKNKIKGKFDFLNINPNV